MKIYLLMKFQLVVDLLHHFENLFYTVRNKFFKVQNETQQIISNLPFSTYHSLNIKIALQVGHG